MSEDGLSSTPSHVREIVVPARDVVHSYEPLSSAASRLAVELLASVESDLRRLRETLQEVAQEIVRQTLLSIEAMNSIDGILVRQRETIALIAASFQPIPIPTSQELRQAEVAFRENMPETPEQVQQVGQLSETISADPQHQVLLRRVSDALKQADLSNVPPVAVPALLYWWLCHHLGLSLTGQVTSAQSPVYLTVITVVLTVLFGMRSRS
jgi:hypothetical protein